MKAIYKKLSVILTSLILFSSVLTNAKASTTVGDSTFFVEKDEVYIWTITKSPGAPYEKGDKIRLTIEDIGNGTYLTVDVAIINCTIDIYVSDDEQWQPYTPSSPYIYFNETQDYIKITTVMMASLGWIFIIPMPINLTLIAEYLNTSFPVFDNVTSETYANGGQVVGEDFGEGTEYIYDYDDNGILTDFKVKGFGSTFYQMEFGDIDLDKKDDKDDKKVLEIPLGNWFLIFTLLSVIALIILKKRKSLE